MPTMFARSVARSGTPKQRRCEQCGHPTPESLLFACSLYAASPGASPGVWHCGSAGAPDGPCPCTHIAHLGR